MKKLDIWKSFQNKKFKYGGFATLMTIVVVAILIVVNLFVDQLEIKVDLTQNKMYSLSEQTYDILDGLQQDVTIYGLYETGAEVKTITEILDKYTAKSDKIKIEYKDPILYPQFTLQYDKDNNGISPGSLIVESGNKFKVIDQYDLVNYSYDPQNPYSSQAESLAVEQRVTGALAYVTSDKNPVIYTLKGHDEGSLPYEVSEQLDKENYEVQELNLLTFTEELGEDSTLLIIDPKRDISTEEADKIRDYLGKGGRAVVLLGMTQNELPNFEGILASYGVERQKAIVVEGDASHKLQQSPIHLLPITESHDITESLRSADLPVMMPGAQGIAIKDVKKRTVDIQPLLTTTENSWGKTNVEATTPEKEEGDLEGPFNLAVAITDTWYEDNNEMKTKLVVVANTNFLNSQMVPLESLGNLDFMMNSFNWLQEQKENLSIRPKDLGTQPLQVNGLQQMIFAGFVTILIPLLVLGAGLMVWLRRRHR